MITEELIKEMFPNCADRARLVDGLNRILPDYGFTTRIRVAAFLAQTGHETMGYYKFRENMNYSAEGLCKVFPGKFPTLAKAKPYARQPERIANCVYAGKNGNGDESSGDGWRFRGAGCLHLTGRYNFNEFAKYINKSLDSTIEYIDTLDGAIESACFFWVHNDLNRFADREQFISLTKAINGGTNGLEERTKLYKIALDLL